MHLWAAERFCEICNISDKDILQEIIIGAEFPDIRYTAHSERNSTHSKVLDIEEVYKSNTPFEAGMKLHSWIDNIREEFIPEKIYDEIDFYSEGFSATLLKFVEDEILSDFYDGRIWSSYFNDILSEELSYTNKETISKWHKMIQWTISIRISNLLWLHSYKGPLFGISESTLYDWSYLLPELKNKLIFQQYMSSLLTYIENELLKHPSQNLFSGYKKSTSHKHY